MLRAAPSPMLHDYLLTAMLTGMRRAELDWLTWDDVDLDKAAILIRPKEGWSPKRRRTRTLPTPPELRNALTALPRRTRWVFARPDGSQVKESWLRKRIREIKHAAGLTSRLTIRKLRHTFTSQRAEERWSFKLIGA